DSTGLYVADSSNNRVLHYPVGSTIADFVYGQGTPGNSQANFTSNASGNGATGLNNPRDVAVDSTGLYVVDSSNNRVLHYIPGNPTADRVYGQLDFASTSVQANQGLDNPTAATLDNPTMVALDKQGALYIADRNNNRILYYAPSISLRGNDPSAVRVYGQKGYTTRHSSMDRQYFQWSRSSSCRQYWECFRAGYFQPTSTQIYNQLACHGPSSYEYCERICF
ncbi:MAG TPA: hypothetical protein DCL75_05225, partial [Ktedonobacter sp.]|nr:hypothetical protein [Ktedonobacter sp.]